MSLVCAVLSLYYKKKDPKTKKYRAQTCSNSIRPATNCSWEHSKSRQEQMSRQQVGNEMKNWVLISSPVSTASLNKVTTALLHLCKRLGITWHICRGEASLFRFATISNCCNRKEDPLGGGQRTLVSHQVKVSPQAHLHMCLTVCDFIIFVLKYNGACLKTPKIIINIKLVDNLTELNTAIH